MHGPGEMHWGLELKYVNTGLGLNSVLSYIPEFLSNI